MAKKLLIVEDEKILGDMYEETFSQAGYEVSLTSSVEEGLKTAKSIKPDLILLDILLSQDNGLVFLKKLREDSELSLTPVIAFSNYDDPETKKEAIKLGVKDYLLKTDFTPQAIVEKVKGYL
ncbi:response regulator [Patescibacteria group bacterium]